MKLLQGGAPKCGNFWLYRIVQEVLRRSGREASSFIEKQPIYALAKQWDLNYPSQASIDVLEITDLQCSYRISSIYRRPIEDLRAYLAESSHVWTHSPICKRSEQVFAHFDKKLYIIRDPRERAVSASKYYTSPYMLKYFPQEERDPEKFLEKNLESLLREWVWHVYDHLRLRERTDTYVLFYEALLADFQKELAGLLGYLGLELGAPDREALARAVSFSTLQKENPQHLRQGKAGSWREVLTEEQKATAEAIAGPLMDYLGYGGPGSPHLPGRAAERELEEVKSRLGG